MAQIDCNSCETSVLFGAAGVCDQVLNICLCPDGFSGKDDWETFDDCSVNLRLKTGVHRFLSVVSALGFLATVAVTVVLLIRWRFGPKCCVMGCCAKLVPESVTTFGTKARSLRSNSLQASVTNRDVSEFGSRAAPSEQQTMTLANRPVELNSINLNSGVPISSDKSTEDWNRFFRPPKPSLMLTPTKRDAKYRTWQRKRWSLFVCFQLAGMYMGALFYQQAFLQGFNRQDYSFKVDTGFFLMNLFGTTGATGIFLSWVYTMPNLSRYGGLLQITPFLVRNPDAIKHYVYGSSVLMFILCLVCIWIVPYLDDSRLRGSNIALLFFLVIYNIIHTIIMVLLIWNIRGIFRQAIEALKRNSAAGYIQADKSREIEALEEAKKGATRFRTYTLISTLLSTGLLIRILNIGLAHIYILFNLSQLVTYIGLFGFVVTFIKSNGGFSPQKSDS